ncbi:zinc ribbon domain-containing protein [Scytonema sp. PRP1]|uniref:zinc ribbon domain-containing protein n=1 Tax=Scytonema sp. PRP1 TaxID=3120513 RepID=UPI002FD4C0B1
MTSQKCSDCGAVVRKSLSTRTHKCACGCEIQRDVNAAINILNLAKAEAARCGGSLRCSDCRRGGQSRSNATGLATSVLVGETSPVRVACPKDIGGSPSVGNWRAS